MNETQNETSTADRRGSAAVLCSAFEAWARESRSEYVKVAPYPLPYVWNPRAWGGAIKRWCEAWGRWLKPQANEWWKARGYSLHEAANGQWFVEPNDPSSATGGKPVETKGEKR